jgi:hypothetical protein
MSASIGIATYETEAFTDRDGRKARRVLYTLDVEVNPGFAPPAIGGEHVMAFPPRPIGRYRIVKVVPLANDGQFTITVEAV